MSGNLVEQVFLTVKPFTAVLDLLYQKQTFISVFYLFVFLYLIIYLFFIANMYTRMPQRNPKAYFGHETNCKP